MRRGVLIAAIFGLALLWAPSASAAVFASNGCGKSEFEPELIGLACADGKVKFEVREWTSWGATEAVGVGLLKHPDLNAPGRCQRTILACPWVESEATATFYRPTYCPTNKRRQFTRLRIVAPNDSDPELREIERDFRCSEYSSPLPRNIVRFLSTREASRLMRDALARKRALSFDGGYNRKVKCNKRVSRIRVRCRMSWNFGDISVAGKGVIWFTYEGGQTYWNYAYRVRKTNHYCQATGGGNCVETIVVR
jgi:hypothetical protein